MRRYIIMVFLAFFSMNAFGQDDAISKFFTKYEDDERFTRVFISGKMFSIFARMAGEEQEEDEEMAEAVKKVKGLKILSASDVNGLQLYHEAFDKLKKAQFEELMVVREKDEEFQFLIKESGNVIKELLMLSGGNGEFMILSLIGDIDLDKISKVSANMEIDGLEHLEKVRDK